MAARAAAGRLLVHGDEHAAAGRAPGDRGDHRARSGRVAVPCRGGREAAASRRPTCGSMAMPSRRGFMPRTRSAASCRRPASSWRWGFPRGEGMRIDTGVEEGDGGDALLRSDDRQGDRAWPRPRRRRWTGWPRRWARRSWSGRTPMPHSSRRSARRRSFAQGSSTPASSTATWMRSGAVPRGSTLARPPPGRWRSCARRSAQREPRSRGRDGQGAVGRRRRFLASGPRAERTGAGGRGRARRRDARLGRGRSVAVT